MKILEELRDIIGKHPLIGDGALLLLVVGSAFFVQPAYWGLQPPHLNSLVTMISALLVIIPLTWRRYFLMTALIFVALTLVVPDVFNIISRVNLSSIASIIAVFSKAAYGGRRRNLICFASIVAFNGGLVYKLVSSSDTVIFSNITLFNITGLFWNLSTFFAIWWFGNTMRVSRERTSFPGASKEQVVQSNQKNVRCVVFYDLGFITQRLYSMLAHNIRGIAIHARAACQVIKQFSKKGLNSFNRSKQSILYIVVEVYRLFSLLWDEKQIETDTDRSDLLELEKLAIDVQTSGLQVKVEGEKREVSYTA